MFQRRNANKEIENLIIPTQILCYQINIIFCKSGMCKNECFVFQYQAVIKTAKPTILQVFLEAKKSSDK